MVVFCNMKVLGPSSQLRSRRDLKAAIIEESLGVLVYKRGVRFIDSIDNWPITLCNVVELKPQLMKYLEHICASGTQGSVRTCPCASGPL